MTNTKIIITILQVDSHLEYFEYSHVARLSPLSHQDFSTMSSKVEQYVAFQSEVMKD